MAGRGPRLVPSPRVATYDLQPEMSAPGSPMRWSQRSSRMPTTSSSPTTPTPTWSAIRASGTATVAAIEALDACLGRVVDAVARADADRWPRWRRARCCVITADHGNADEMHDAAGEPVTAHSLNPVPILIDRLAPCAAGDLHDGVLADVAPTLLAAAGRAALAGMTGRSLLDVAPSTVA